VYADPSLFDFIIRNLIANALKYTPHGGAIKVNADTHSKPGFTVFEVKDNGIGMDKSVMGRIFSSPKSTQGTDNEKGHGIGLMLCKEFAVLNGGDIWVESEPGKGASFFFSVKNAA
jgi:signal transduction histidine kinase